MNSSKPIVALMLALAISPALAQDEPSRARQDGAAAVVSQEWQGLPEAAQQALEEGNEAMAEALATYDAQYPDRRLWQEAFRHGRRAMSLAPEHPAPLRFLAEAYSRANWYGPAWDAWLEYLERGNLLDAEATPLFSNVGAQLGYTYYQQGELEEAAEVYTQIIEVIPFDLQAHAWMGRIMVETGRPEQAISYWQTVVDRNPSDERAQYFLELAREQARWGTRAVNAFREGVALYEEGNLDQARERFARASSINPEYAEAWAWLGRVAFENENYLDARTYYRRASSLRPENETYAYFLEESDRRVEATAQTPDGASEIEQNAGGGAGGTPAQDGPDTNPARPNPLDEEPPAPDEQP